MNSVLLDKYEVTIGLEIHVQLSTKSKMFCRCSNDATNAQPNTLVCPICMGYPGTLPVMNKKAIEYGLRASLALGCEINPLQRFDRKNYFYPDLPKGYQISQFFFPVGERGKVDVDYLAADKRTKKEFSVGITRLHLEEDAGKLTHGVDASYVDLNRCGTPLAEIVTEPDIKSPEEAKFFLQELQRIVQNLGVSEASMEKGHLRVDGNISIRPIGQSELGNKVEIKNLNSFKFLEQALNFEIQRQVDLLEKGERIVQETRGWDEKTNTTKTQRIKEGSVDYRYFPEPDLPPVKLSEAQIAEQKAELKHLPSVLRDKAVKLGLPYNRVIELQDLNALEDYIEIKEKISNLDNGKVANWITKEFDGQETKVKFFGVIAKHSLSNNAIDRLYQLIVSSGGDPEQLVNQLETVDDSALETLVAEVLSENADVVERYKAGDMKLFGVLMGSVMAKSRGSAEPALAKEILEKLLTK